MLSTTSVFARSSHINHRLIELLHLDVQFLEACLNLRKLLVLFGLNLLLLLLGRCFIWRLGLLDDVSENVMTNVHDAAMGDLAIDLVLVAVLDVVFSVEGGFEVVFGEGVVAGTWEIGNVLFHLDELHDLLVSIHFDFAFFLIIVIEHLVEDVEHSSPDVWIDSTTRVFHLGLLGDDRHWLGYQLRASMLLNLFLEALQQTNLLIAISDFVLDAEGVAQFSSCITFMNVDLFGFDLVFHVHSHDEL